MGGAEYTKNPAARCAHNLNYDTYYPAWTAVAVLLLIELF
jgi:hypothetical protein